MDAAGGGAIIRKPGAGNIRRWTLLLLSFGAWLCALHAFASPSLQGLPLMRHYGAAELPAVPRYSNSAVDAEGTLYVGSGEGVMVLRSGAWDLFELPRKAGVYSLLAANRSVRARRSTRSPPVTRPATRPVSSHLVRTLTMRFESG